MMINYLKVFLITVKHLETCNMASIDVFGCFGVKSECKMPSGREFDRFGQPKLAETVLCFYKLFLNCMIEELIIYMCLIDHMSFFR